jgi:hypothetical protein
MPNYTKNPRKEKKYIEALRFFVKPPRSSTSSSTNAAEEDSRRHELEKPLRIEALNGVEIDTRHQGRDEANGD